MSFAADVWNTLSAVDCSKHVEKKQNLTYLSWAWAWAMLMHHYPESSFEFADMREFPDGTQEAWVSVTVRDGEKEVTRQMWLPVLDYANKPVANPNAFQINTTRMRCLTKCLAMFGLGHYIYAGEDVPRPEMDVKAVGEKPQAPDIDVKMKKEYVAGIQAAIYNEDDSGLRELLMELKSDHEMKLACWNALNSRERRYIKDFEKAA